MPLHTQHATDLLQANTWYNCGHHLQLIIRKYWFIINFSKQLTSATFILHRVFYCVARTWVLIGCQCYLLLLGWLLWMNLRRTQCKLRLSRDALVKGLQELIIVHTSRYDAVTRNDLLESSITLNRFLLNWKEKINESFKKKSSLYLGNKLI